MYFCHSALYMENIIIIVLLGVLLIALFLFINRSNRSTNEGYNDSADKLLTERDELLRALAKAEQKSESAIHENESLKSELKASQEALHAAERSIESMNAYLEAQKEKLAEQKDELFSMKQHLNKEFQLLAQSILEKSSTKLNEVNQLSMNALLKPLKDNIRSFEEKVEKTYSHEAAERNTLKGVVFQLMEQSRQIQSDANNLTRALKGDQKQQGNWGEVILERVLERSGLIKNREYRMQQSFMTEEGNRVQPDAIIDLPEDRHLVVDAKVSLVSYERWVNCDDEAEKSVHLRQHQLSIKNHITELARKNYQDLHQINTPDFVLLFIPIEPAFTLSISSEGELFSDAWDKRVVIVSPSTLLATLRTVASVWKQERQNRNVQEIAREAGMLYDKFVGFMDDMDKVDRQIQLLAKTQEDARRKLEFGKGNIVSKIDKLKKLGARANKQLNTETTLKDDIQPADLDNEDVD